MRILNNVEKSFQTHTFPATTEELIDAHGDMEVELPNGSVKLDEVLSLFPEEQFESADDASVLTYGALGEEAIGRKGYSDRDPYCIGEEGHERVSL